MPSIDINNIELYFDHVPTNAIPLPINQVFKNVKQVYLANPSSYRGDRNWDFQAYAIHKDIYNKLFEQFKNGQYIVDFDHYLTSEFSKHLEIGFEKVLIDGYYYYKPLTEVYFECILVATYKEGFVEGYKHNFLEEENILKRYGDFNETSPFKNSDDERIINKIIRHAHKRHDDYVFNVEYDNHIIEPNLLAQFGKEQGKFIRAWEIILLYPDKFIKQFKNTLEKDSLDSIAKIDLSNEKDIDKVRYLIELGVVDYLKDNVLKHSNSSITSALTGVTGMKYRSLQPYINAYLTNSAEKRNPMNNTEAVNKIVQTLTKLGYNPPK